MTTYTVNAIYPSQPTAVFYDSVASSDYPEHNDVLFKNHSLFKNNAFNKLSAERLGKLMEADREKAICMGLWDKFKDLFRSKKKQEVLKQLYSLIHLDNDQASSSTSEMDTATSSKIKVAVKAFMALKQLAHEADYVQNLFKIEKSSDDSEDINFVIGTKIIYQHRATTLLSTGLMDKNPNIVKLTAYLDEFVTKTNALWHKACDGDGKKLCDQQARRDFNRDVLNEQLCKELRDCSFQEKDRMLENLRGRFGRRFRGVLDLTGIRVSQNVEDNFVKVSAANKYKIVVEDIMDILYEKSKLNEVYINNVTELTDDELRALKHSAGITRTMLRDNTLFRYMQR